MSKRDCWCGNNELQYFSDEYTKCEHCNTLVSQKGLTSEETKVKNDLDDFYGQQYWLTHQSNDFGFPNIYQRARSDLPERCLYWLRTLLKYRLPKAKTLELGCAHGGFVALQNFIGYEAQGLELSSWVSHFANDTFGVDVLEGPLDQQNIPPNTYDIIALMDVLEHLSDPVSTLRSCLNVLKANGFLIIQTPCYPENFSYEKLLAEKNSFLQMLQAKEHLYLFSKSSVKKFFNDLGFENMIFEPAIFDHYDMFFVASREGLRTSTTEEIENFLSSSLQGRIIQSLFDLRHQLKLSEADRAARLDVINRLDAALKEKNDSSLQTVPIVIKPKFYKRILKKLVQ